MSTMLVVALDRDTAGHLAVALRRHRGQLHKLGYAEPPGIADLETIAQSVARSHEESHAVTVPDVSQTDRDDRVFLTRHDVQALTGASLSTIDRWIRHDKLPSVKHGRTRRVSRTDLQRFLSARPAMAPEGDTD